MIASLTKAAATEIASREVNVDRKNVGTMHALCYRLLGQPGIAETKVAAWNELHPAMAIDLKVKGSKDDAFSEAAGRSWGTQTYEAIGLARARRTPRDTWTGEMQRFSAAWETWKGESALVDFTDMVEHVLAGEVRPDDSVRVALFDEVQDFSRLELDLARMWGEQLEYVVLVGDPDQAIFEWRGASARDFLEPEIPEDRIRILGQSYRVPRAVHEIAVEWIERCSYRFPVEYKPRDGDGEVLRMNNASYQRPAPIVDDIEECVARGENSMVIASCGYMLAPLMKELKRRGLPFHNPYAKTNGRWNPLRSKGRISAYLVASKAAFGAKARMWTWGELWSWVEVIAAGAVLKTGAKKRIRESAKDEHTSNLHPDPDDLGELFQAEAWFDLCDALDAQERGPDVRWLLENTLSSKQGLVEYTACVYEQFGVFALHGDPLIVVGTIHSVKGAEAQNVFVAPDLSGQGALQWAGAGEARDAVLRVFYVAFTRARERLVLLGRGSGFAVQW